MKRKPITASIVAAIMVGCSEDQPAPAPPVAPQANEDTKAVKINRSAEGVAFVANGSAFRIRGAGGPNSLAELAAAGANATRTWGFDQLEDGLLDEAHENGLMVAVGIWLRHDIDYNDENQVAEQIRYSLDGVRKYKDHPAVLVWGIGNEMEGDGTRTEVWEHVETLAKKIKEIDSRHPTMTVIAEIGGDKLKNLHAHCPSIDIVGINAYGGAASIPTRYRETGGTKPYILTEFGPRGPWDFPQNTIGSVDEELGKIKAATYLESYRAVDADRQLCLGSLAFKWGHKQEATPTWFGMFLADGRKTAAVDVLTVEWSGKPVANRCPQIDSLELVDAGGVKVNATLQAKLDAQDPEGQPLEVEWVLMADAERHLTGGYHQDTPPSFDDHILESSNKAATFRVPDQPGLYRIFAYVGDGQGAADVANVVFRAEPETGSAPAAATENNTPPE